MTGDTRLVSDLSKQRASRASLESLIGLDFHLARVQRAIAAQCEVLRRDLNTFGMILPRLGKEFEALAKKVELRPEADSTTASAPKKELRSSAVLNRATERDNGLSDGTGLDEFKKIIAHLGATSEIVEESLRTGDVYINSYDKKYLDGFRSTVEKDLSEIKSGLYEIT